MIKEREALALAEEQGVIVFKAFSEAKQMPVTLRPMEDETGLLYTGQGARGYFESLTKKEKDELDFIIDHYTAVKVYHDKVLDISGNPIDAANWKWIKRHPYVCMVRAAKSTNPSAVFYVFNPEMEARQSVKSSELRDKARFYIHELSQEKMQIVAKALGLPSPESFSSDKLKSYLLNRADASPAIILELIDPKNAESTNAKVLVKELLKYKVLEKFRGGIYKFGGSDGEFIGRNEDQIFDYITDKENNEIVKSMQMSLEEEKSKV